MSGRNTRRTICGCCKNLAYLTHVTIASSPQPILDIINEQKDFKPLDDCTPKDLFNMVKIFINGRWIGIHYKPYQLYQYLKEKKYQGIINIYTSIIFNYKFKRIHIRCEGGRLMRPILKIRNNKLLLNDEIVQKNS